MNQYFVMMTPASMGSRQVVDALAAMPEVSMALEAPPLVCAVVEAENLDGAHALLLHISNIDDVQVTKVRYAPIAMRRDQVTMMPGLAEASEPMLVEELSGVAPPMPKLKVATPIIAEVPGLPATTNSRVYRNFSSQAGLASLATAGHLGAFGGGLNDHDELAESHLSNPTRITEW